MHRAGRPFGSRIGLCVLSVAALVLGLSGALDSRAAEDPAAAKLALRPPAALAPDSTTVQNEYIQIAVEEQAGNYQGRFTVGNTGGDPANPNDDNRILMYGHPHPWSSFSTIRIDGSDVVFGNGGGTFTQAPTSFGTYIKSVWVSGSIQVSQVMTLSSNPSTGRIDAVEIRYMLENLDLSNSHTVGLRVLLDTMLASNDGAPFRVPGTGAVTTEREYLGTAVPDYWQSFDNLSNPTVVSQQTLRGNDSTVPDRVIFVSWPDFFSTTWDYTVTPGKIFGSTSYPDSAVGLYWNPRTLGPGTRIEFVTYYGLSGLSQSGLPPLSLSVTGPLSLQIVNGAYSPNPFTVSAYLQNLTTAPLGNISVRIETPAGLTVEGAPTSQTFAAIDPNEIVSASWPVRAANQTADAVLTYRVVASGAGLDDRVVDRGVLVPALSLTYDTGYRANPNGWQFQNFGHPASLVTWDFFRNTFGADEVEISGQPRPRAQSFFTNSFQTVGAGGSCYGMASSSTIIWLNSHLTWDLGAVRARTLEQVGEPYTDANNNANYDLGESFTDRNGNLTWDSARSWGIFPPFLHTLTDWVEYFHLRQLDAAILTNRVNGTPNQVYDALKQRMASGNWSDNPVLFLMWWPGAGHAITPYRIEESADHTQADLRVYDNNFPNQQRTVHFDLAANTVRDADYNGGANLSFIALDGLIAIQSEPQMADYDAVTPTAHLGYTDEQGRRLGFFDGEFYNEIPDAFRVVVPMQASSDPPPETYFVGDLPLRRQIRGSEDGTTTVSISRPRGLAVVTLDVTPSSVDEVRVAPDAGNLEVIGGVGSRSMVMRLDRETEELARQIEVGGVPVETGARDTLSLPNDLSTGKFVNGGGGKGVSLSLEQIGPGAGKFLSPDQVWVEPGAALWATPGNWADLRRTVVRLDHDLNNDGHIEYTEVRAGISGAVDVDPDTIALGSNGTPITAYVQLPSTTGTANVNLNSIRIQTLQGRYLSSPVASLRRGAVGDHNNDGIPDIMVQFNRAVVMQSLQPGTAAIGIVGTLSDGRSFSGSDTVRVIARGNLLPPQEKLPAR